LSRMIFGTIKIQRLTGSISKTRGLQDAKVFSSAKLLVPGWKAG
jgi:hypothetical protein